MSKEIIAYDELNGITQYHHYDADMDTSVFESVGDAGPVLELNRAMANDNDMTRQGMKQDFWLYARIPMIFQLKLMQEHNICIWKREDGNRLSQILEDPQYRHLKTTTKKHIIKAHD